MLSKGLPASDPHSGHGSGLGTRQRQRALWAGKVKGKKRKGRGGQQERKSQVPKKCNFTGILPSSVSQRHELLQLLTPASERQERSHEGSSNTREAVIKAYFSLTNKIIMNTNMLCG